MPKHCYDEINCYADVGGSLCNCEGCEALKPDDDGTFPIREFVNEFRDVFYYVDVMRTSPRQCRLPLNLRRVSSWEPI